SYFYPVTSASCHQASTASFFIAFIRLKVVKPAPRALTVTEWLRINVIPVTHRTSCHVQSGHGGSLPGMFVTTSL
ncbi:hypothetical protein, partial [Citrobacter freundii]|uniref:hypothetical protein n=1 Tax=Citrobacter freundii TaxID=546 RepID=UPI001F42EE83